ncbi:MAG: Protease HtpX-like protein [Candidatus Uhrbacteria bacterium GW2011_GWD2_52_7]|uniref:Protease HtpX homolog n=1 Tax=Candidatus Uhrbacteria bacterium GW2011_GWD2_52_7 TaxID=1618989 RepID=A0A0G1XH35_9BACT|nr:MAG: Protease HtpX-like protein [Candidatus Uhrbacteria bacterium GW2011_GWD2_52_7]
MYNQIAANKRKTWVLIIAMTAVILGLSWLFGVVNNVDPASTVIIGTMFSTVYALISYYASASIALASSGARQIQKSDAPELWNLVENLCIANGQPMPKVYIINDASPNAFATGRDPEHAAIAFTTGLVQILDRKELEGVAAHELSHIKNYDIRVMTIVVVLVGAVMLIADMLLRGGHIFGGRDNKNAGGAAVVLLIVGLVLAILSPLLAQLIQLAVSRSREYLADASAALLTRYPAGLASALQKISATQQPLARANHATAHLFISSPFGTTKKRGFWRELFSTHPPAEDRIARLMNMGG